MVLPAKQPTEVFLEKSSECPEVLRLTSWLAVGLSAPVLTQPDSAFSSPKLPALLWHSGLSIPQEVWALSEQDQGLVQLEGESGSI